jgi:hypothetical protein
MGVHDKNDECRKTENLRGISELKGTIRVRGNLLEIGYQEVDWNRRIRDTVFPRVITVCSLYRMTRLNAQHSFLSVSSVIQISAQKGTVISDVSQ